MKNYLFYICLSFFMMNCSTKKEDLSQTVTDYYNGFKTSDYSQIQNTLSDSLTLIEGDYVTPFTHKSYHEQFKWDSVFKPRYEIIEIKKLDDKVAATVSVYSPRFEFLKNNPLTCTHLFSFTSGTIAKIENQDCGNANWEVWQKERDSLVKWTRIHHPKLDGFINDLSMNGGINYLKAIELYQESKGAETE